MDHHAGLPMYDFAEIKSATDEFWRKLHGTFLAHGIKNVPQTLTRPDDLPAFWSDASLLFGQTCGYPFVKGLCGDAQYVATPCYKTRFCSGTNHKSVIITNQDSAIRDLADARGKVCAINMTDSNTGMNLLRLEIAKLNPSIPFFARIYETGAHRKSIEDVATGKADIASIDCVTFALLERIDPAAIDHVRIIAETEETPNLPFITSGNTDAKTISAMRDSLAAVIAERENRDLLQSLMLDDIVVLTSNAYERVREIEQDAIRRNYPELK